MERREPLPPVTGTWARPHYGDLPAQGPQRFPQYPPLRSGEPHPRDYYPGGGAQRAGPWEIRPPYDAGPEQRASSADSRGGVSLQGPLPPGGPPRPDVFPYGGPRPGIPHPPVPAGRTQDMGPGTLHRAGDHYGNAGIMLNPGPEPPLGTRPQQCLPAGPQGASSWDPISQAPALTGPNAFTYRAPGTQPAPTPENPQQGFYHLPPMHGNPPNPSYAAPPLAGSADFCESIEGDLGVPSALGNTHFRHHLLNQQSPGPLPSGMVAGRNFEHDGPFLFQHGIPDGRRDPNLLLQPGGPFVSQPTPYIQDSFMCLDRQTCAMEKGGPEDKDVFVRWLSSFLSCRRKEPPAKTAAVQAPSVAEARELMYSALRLVSQLDTLCQALESLDKGGKPWTREYEKAADIRVDLEEKLKELEKPGYIQGVKRKLDIVHKKRLRRQRRRQAAEEEEKEAAERSAEKEAKIDLWRMQCIQKVEEKKRERELKATADWVLGEVRKKQNDVKKMLDVLKSLEKLRKLRKEAAGRKGVCPPPSADETFTNHINRLRTLVHKRSALYDAEEKTLRVILEGEQEEERQRAKDKSLKKEREKTLQKQRELDCILFGDAEFLPSLPPLQPFRQYYLQAEHSVVSLVQIRHEWDQFLVPPDHPDGSSVPRGWVVPTAPCNNTWATALKQSD
ncbi:unnamed protein product [Ranitomeya imitator]|uniref:Programmed cell death 7 n=1 Tax=Ranitomeya imitator TaxID=111125 RepID=A0ABN9M9J2_9NEOB|nr:unnamed protein product [Ranitomeya imitator]